MEPVAIVGMAFKFPGGAETPEKFWDMLLAKRCAATEYPKDRFNVDSFWSPHRKKLNTITSREGHFVDGDTKNFDAGFFSMAPHEVGSMDPQHRGLLENTYHAFESAGLRLEDVAGTKTSVHVGCFTTDFAMMQFRDAQNMPKYNSLGAASSMLANRISWFFDLRGESLYVDTACSSSLVALALACKGLASGESDIAVVGGANLILIPEYSISLSNMNFLSSNGRCNSFDAKGDGYGRGEGFATLILKPLSKALADGNPVRALIRSIGTNQDGFTSGGITQPSKDMQVRLIRDTYTKAGLDLKHTRFFEAHGTGTAIGDPVEASAIGKAFFNYRSASDPVYVGAVKSNIGHLEGASGLAGVVKAILALERGFIPPNTNFDRLNPLIDADFFNLKFPTECIPWPGNDPIRRASVNSFGFGGSNSHVVLEATDGYFQSQGYRLPHHSTLYGKQQGPNLPTRVSNGNLEEDQPGHLASRNPATDSHHARIVVLSSADEEGVARQAAQLSYPAFLARPHDRPDRLGDVLYTLNSRRTMFDWKAFCVLNELDELLHLKTSLSKPIRHSYTDPSLGLVFTGQGAQWPGMATELLNWPVFRESLSTSQRYLTAMGCNWCLIREIQSKAESSSIDAAEFSQAVTTAIQLALVDLLESFGVQPSVVVGHSSGEIAAAYCAGYLNHESSMKVSYFRGFLASCLARQSTISCGMASVGLPASEVPDMLSRLRNVHAAEFDPDQITISCINSPTNTTLSGPTSSLGLIIEHLASQGTFARKLKVDLGYHSPQMQQMSSDYMERISGLMPRPEVRAVHMVSSVQGKAVSLATVCAEEYWVQNLESPVRFTDAIDECLAQNPEHLQKFLDRSHLQKIVVHAWLEVGPHAALKGPLRQVCQAQGRQDVRYTSLLMRNRPADKTVMEAVGQLFCQGIGVDLEKASCAHDPRQREPSFIVDLPQYPFNHSIQYWEVSNMSKMSRANTGQYCPLLGYRTMDWNPLDARWRLTIKKDKLPWISDHRINGAMWYPAAGMVAMAVEAAKQLLPDTEYDFELQNVSFSSPIVIPDGPEGTEASISMAPATKIGEAKVTEYRFRILVRRDTEKWEEACDGTITAHRGQQTSEDITEHEEARDQRSYALNALNAMKQAVSACGNSILAEKMYRKLHRTTGLQYGSSFQGLADIRYNRNGHSCAQLLPATREVSESSMPYTVHPATLDAIFQLAVPALSEGLSKSLPTLVPTRFTRLWISRDGIGGLDATQEPSAATVHGSSQFLTSRHAQMSATVFSPLNSQVAVQVEELDLAEVAGEKTEPANEKDARAMCHEIEWKPDITLMNSEELLRYCSTERSTIGEPVDWYQNIRLMLLGFAQEALEAMKKSNQKPVPSMERYAGWLKARLDESETEGEPGSACSRLPSPVQLQTMADYFESTGYRGAVGSLVARKLGQILVGETDPLQMLFADPQYLCNVYEEANTTGKAFPMLHCFLDAMVHKDPGLKFLEIGAGTGASTNMILQTVANDTQGPRYGEYVFTDVSGYFLPPAQARFHSYDRITYQTLDIEQDIEAQGFHPGSYDVVVAVHVLHTTRDLSVSLANVRKLVKPHGKLILVEYTSPNKIDTGFVWGTLPGWWLGGESFREQSAVVDEQHWDHLLRKASFSGTELVFRDWDSDVCHGWSIMVSSAREDELPDGPGPFLPSPIMPTRDVPVVVSDEASAMQLEVAKAITQKLGAFGSLNESAIVGFSEATTEASVLRGKNCVLLVDLDGSKLREPDPDTFRSYQKVLTEPRAVLWVQQRQEEEKNDAPFWAISEGLSRVCRNENPFTQVVNLTLEATAQFSPHRMAGQVIKVSKATNLLPNGVNAALDAIEHEYMEISGRLCVNRLRSARYLDRHIQLRACDTVRDRIFGSGCPLKLRIRQPGLLDTMEWVEDKAVHYPLEPDQVEVQVKAVGVNFKDCLTLLGRVKSDVLGSECAGYVMRTGAHVKRFSVGDRVAVGWLGTYRTVLRAKETHVALVPSSMSLEEAAGITTAFCTAYHSLLNVARLTKGETILIHAAAGGTGQAAVQIAQYVGAEIYATVGSPAKRKLLIDQYGLREDHIFNSRDASFADGIRRMTSGRGVDVVLNSLSGKLLVASWC
ncbi:reducing type I polyketide synthase [Xylariomycetidae sp. FL0641]|nr:reducing type I polyketide synthase [Xylariomycetidae sp. FL0641]